MRLSREPFGWLTQARNLLLLVSIAVGAGIIWSGAVWATEPPEEEPKPSWGCIKCCFKDDTSCCCPSGKTLTDEPCRFTRIVTSSDLPLDGYLVSEECLVLSGPWNEDDVRACQGELERIELNTAADLSSYSYSYVHCEGGLPYIVKSESQESVEERTGWGSIKALYR